MKRPTKKAEARTWHVALIRKRTEHLGRVGAPDWKADEAAAVEKLKLTDEQRKRLVLQEQARRAEPVVLRALEAARAGLRTSQRRAILMGRASLTSTHSGRSPSSQAMSNLQRLTFWTRPRYSLPFSHLAHTWRPTLITEQGSKPNKRPNSRSEVSGQALSLRLRNLSFSLRSSRSLRSRIRRRLSHDGAGALGSFSGTFPRLLGRGPNHESTIRFIFGSSFSGPSR